MRTWLLGVATVLVLMLGIIIGTSNFVSVIIDQFTAGTATPTVIPTIPATAPPAATPSPELAASPTITPTVQGTWPPQNGTMLARIRDRGFLICGISGDIPGFSYIEEDADGLNSIDPDIVKNANLPEEVLGVLYDDATGLDVDYCRALAVAIWGQYWGKVAFLTLSLDENLPYYRFTAVEQGLVDVAFRNTTWNMRRELRVAFGPVIYYDSLKFMVDPEVLGGEQFKEAADAIKYLAARTEKICVLPGTTTVETMQNLFGAERIITDTIVNQKKEPFRLNGQLIEDYSTGECPIIASDEALLIAQQWLNKEKKNDNRLDKAVIIPQNQGTTFEPLAPFVAQGDSQWLNILNQVIWATMYAEQIGVTMEEIKLLKDDPNADPKIIEECIKNLAQKNALPEQNYKDFLGIQAGSFTQAKRPELGNIEGDYALQIIRQVGNYGEIFASNLGEKGFPRGSNCVWNPLKQLVTQPGDNPNEVGNPVTLEDKCRLVIPPL